MQGREGCGSISSESEMSVVDEAMNYEANKEYGRLKRFVFSVGVREHIYIHMDGDFLQSKHMRKWVRLALDYRL
jgi:hypothetical protein